MKYAKFLIVLLMVVVLYNCLAHKPLFSLAKSEATLICANAKEFYNKGDSTLNFAVKSKDLLGVTVGLYSEDCGTWLSTAGFLNKQKTPNKSSLFRIASISKPMTAVAILQLYEKGKIDLDVPIQNYLPDFPKKKKGKITIRQLLKHKSGIPHYRSKLGIFNFRHYDNCIHALEKFKNRKLSFEPGTSFLYSSYGYTVLGAIIEKVSGKSYQEYMKENIWKPAQMSRTDIEENNLKYDNKAALYIKTGYIFIKSPKNDLSYTYPSGGIHSTAEDLLKFGKAILNYELINPTTTKLMIALSAKSNKEKEYTYGWDTWISSKYGKIIEHNGTQVGASSFFRIYFDKKIIVATMANNLNSSEEVRSLSLKLAKLAIDKE